MTKSMKYLSSSPWSIGASIILSTGCSTTSKHVEVCEPVDLTHICPEPGHGPCPFCPSELEVSISWFQAYDSNWDDPSINPIFDTKDEAEKYASRNNMASKGGKVGHQYTVREINHRYEVRQVHATANDLLHMSSEFNDAYEYVVEYSSAHSDLVIFDLKTGRRFEETP